MNAPQLLETIRGRGGKITVALDQTGAAKIQIAPRGLVGDLAGEIVRQKIGLLELLELPDESRRIAPQRAQTVPAPNLSPDAPNGPQIALNAQSWPDIPQNRNYYGKTAEFRALATAILDARRPNGANELTNTSLSSPQLANWARALLGEEEN